MKAITAKKITQKHIDEVKTIKEIYNIIRKTAELGLGNTFVIPICSIDEMIQSLKENGYDVYYDGNGFLEIYWT